jgi:pimeloyl-ACP methyl ester carboxylesterase
VKKIVFHSVLSILLLILLNLTTAFAQTTSSVVTFSINIRNNVTVQMGATVISKTDSSGSNKNSILVLNGTSQTVKPFEGLAKSLLASDAKVSKMILLDLPGHGNSNYPVGSGVKFGDLTMDDYVTALLSSLEKLEDLKLKTNSILAHSLSAEIVQMAQNRLLSQGDDLRHEFGIKSAIFIAPDIASPLPWAAIDAGGADPLAIGFMRDDATLGNVFDLVTLPGGQETWIGLFYGTRTGTLPTGAPTPAQAIANGFVSFESGQMAKELIGLPNTPGGERTPRPTINSNLFTSRTGTIAAVITLEQDSLYIFPDEHRAVYRFITGDQSDRLFFPLTGPDTVHNVHTITPSIYNHIIKQVLDTRDDYDDNDDND